MGEAKTRSRTRAQILAGEARCIYCSNPPTSVEHMPPRWVFHQKHRPSGLEFASCDACNTGTKAADFVTGFMARLRVFKGDRNDPLFKEALERNGSLDQLAPGLRDQVFSDANITEEWVQGPGGILQKVTKIDAKSPILARLLGTFGAKLAMALFREHVGSPLPLDGETYVQPFMNGGFTQEQADALLGMMPMHGSLRQGKFSVGEQFGYRFNCDSKTIVAALVHFHHNMHFFLVATSEPSKYGPVLAPMSMASIRPGELGAVKADSLLPRRLQGNASENSPRGSLIMPGQPGWPGVHSMQ